MSRNPVVRVEVLLEFPQRRLVAVAERRLAEGFARPVGPDLYDSARAAVLALHGDAPSVTVVVVAHRSHLTLLTTTAAREKPQCRVTDGRPTAAVPPRRFGSPGQWNSSPTVTYRVVVSTGDP